MSKFTDANGRQWEVYATPHERDRVKELCGFDFYDLVNKDKAGGVMGRLEGVTEDSDDLVRDLLVSCVSPDDEKVLRSGLYGNALNDGLEAFFKALANFYRSPQHKRAIASMLQLMQYAAAKHSEIADVIGDEATDLIANLIDGIDAKQLVRTSTNSAGSLQDSQDSTSNQPADADHGGTVFAS